MTDFNHYNLARDNNVDLSFDGTLLSDVSSRTDSSPRWTEIRIYHTATDKFVCEIVGESLVSGEEPRRKAIVANTPKALRKSLERKNSEGVVYLTYLALDALDEAAERFPPIRGALVEAV